MTHLTMDEIIELAIKLTSDEIMNDGEIEKLQHLKECKGCYERFGVAVALCDATSPDGIALVTEAKKQTALQSEEVKEPLSVIKVVRQKVNDIKTAIMEQLDGISAAFSFEPALAMATRGDDSKSGISMVKLEELDDEKTYIAFDTQKNELYVQINAHNYSDTNIGIYLLCENKKIIEVPVVLESGFFKGQLTDVPDGDFRIYIDED